MLHAHAANISSDLQPSFEASTTTHPSKSDTPPFPLPWPPAHSATAELRDLLAYYSWLIIPCASTHNPGNPPRIALKMLTRTAAGLLADIAAADLSCVPSAPMHVLDALRTAITEALLAAQSGGASSRGTGIRRKWSHKRLPSPDRFSRSPPPVARPSRKRRAGHAHACNTGAQLLGKHALSSQALAAHTPLTVGMPQAPLRSVDAVATQVEGGLSAQTAEPAARRNDAGPSPPGLSASVVTSSKAQLKAWPTALPSDPSFKPLWHPEDYYRSTQALSTLVATGKRTARACRRPQHIGNFALQPLSCTTNPCANSKPGVVVEVPLATASMLIDALRAAQHPHGRRHNARKASGAPYSRDFAILRCLYFVLVEAAARRRECHDFFSGCLGSRQELSFADCSLTGAPLRPTQQPTGKLSFAE